MCQCNQRCVLRIVTSVRACGGETVIPCNHRLILMIIIKSFSLDYYSINLLAIFRMKTHGACCPLDDYQLAKLGRMNFKVETGGT